MLKTFFVLLMSLAAALVFPIYPQSPENITFKVTVVDNDLNLKNVPKFALVVRRTGVRDTSEMKLVTNADGFAKVDLAPGIYSVASATSLTFQNRSFSWELSFAVERGKVLTVELSSDNAKISGSANTPSKAW